MQVGRIVSSWNFLHTFARPLGLQWIPTLPELCDAVRAMQNDPEESAGRAMAKQLWEELCMTLVRAITPDLEAVLGLRGTAASPTIENLFSKTTGVFLPLNTLTWREIARQGLLMQIYAAFSFSGERLPSGH